ncbi:MAG: glycosyltransferase [Candidatus Leucobacter sulfamidivorax]|nr:glycosyltransferase [Candidatus Leucobacter sulfamidivorax]
MRFAIAIAVLVLSGIAFILGIGQRTFLAPPAEIALTAGEGTTSSYAVVPASAFAAAEGDPVVAVAAKGAFAAVGSQRDVEAWVAAFDHASIEAQPKAKSLEVSEVRGDPTLLRAETETQTEAATETQTDAAEPATGTESESDDASGDENDEFVDPRGSDLWVSESGGTGDGTLRFAVEIDDDEAVLIATSGSAGLGDAVSLVWEQDRSTPFAGPLLVTGAVLAVLGAVLYLLAVDHDRRGLGPRRGSSGPLPGIRGAFSRRRDARKLQRMAAPAAVLAGALALSGCSASYWPDFSAQPTEQATEAAGQAGVLAPVPITPEQIDRITADISQVAGTADDALDVEALKSRFTGDALAQREASYKIRSAMPDYERVPLRIGDEQLEYELVQSTEGWPRTVFVAVSSEPVESAAEAEAAPAEGEEAQDQPADQGAAAEEASSPSLMLIMTQQNPHENYLVSRIITLRGGIEMPEAAPAEEGTALLSPELQTLVLPPGEVGTAYAAVLQGGSGVEQAETFDLEGDPLMERSGLAWVQQMQEKADAEGYSVAYSVAASVGEQPITALSTGVGGGLVAVTVVEERVSDTAGSTTRVRAEGAVSAVSGLTGQQERIVSVVAHQLLFFVPSKVSGEQIQLLGATSELVGARN